jgi:hypothetical protein
MLGCLGRRRSQKLGEVWKFWQRMRGRIVGIEVGERRHLAGRVTLIYYRGIGRSSEGPSKGNG